MDFYPSSNKRSQSRTCNKIVRLALLAVQCLSLSYLPCLAYNLDDPLKHFLHQNGNSTLPFISWSKTSINYEHVGDNSPLVNGKIDMIMEMISNSSGLNISRGAKTASIYLIYQSNIFEQLMSEPDKLKSAGFSDAIVEELRKNFGNKPTLKCISQDVVDGRGNITGAFILSSTTTDDCIKPLIYQIFGIATSQNDAENLIYGCILYDAKHKGLTTPEAISSNLSLLSDKCLPSLH